MTDSVIHAEARFEAKRAERRNPLRDQFLRLVEADAEEARIARERELREDGE